MLAFGAAGAGLREVERMRALLFAFMAGIALAIAPAAGLALGISGAWRWPERA